jgi:hypothetical protein
MTSHKAAIAAMVGCRTNRKVIGPPGRVAMLRQARSTSAMKPWTRTPTSAGMISSTITIRAVRICRRVGDSAIRRITHMRHPLPDDHPFSKTILSPLPGQAPSGNPLRGRCFAYRGIAQFWIVPDGQLVHPVAGLAGVHGHLHRQAAVVLSALGRAPGSHSRQIMAGWASTGTMTMRLIF